MQLLQTTALFIGTALAEIVGCYLPYLWLRGGKSPWLLVPGAISLAVFAWLLTLHPTAAGRIYAAYGGVYISVAIVWLWLVDGIRPQTTDAVGVGLCLIGMLVIMWGLELEAKFVARESIELPTDYNSSAHKVVLRSNAYSLPESSI